ncbi:MAG TPA: aldo/keto reductase [Polyangiaceae bacterium]|nr:aldo/keto reductase [Polyangiaceae bacterium]
MTLKKRTLGKSGIQVTEIGLGLWAAGGGEWGETDDKESLSAIDAALDQGVTFFDTADVYGNGHSEEVLGRAMRGRRDRFIVASKIGWRGFDGEKRATAYKTPALLIAGVESNLARLQTDHIDVLQSHISFRDPTMEVFLEGFQKLKRDGKVRAYGMSSSDYEYIRAFNQDEGCATLQIDYSLLNRTPEPEIFEYCSKHGIGVIVRGALAMGILTGKLKRDSAFGEGDFRRKWQTEPDQRAVYERDLASVAELRGLERNGRTLAQAALQFTLAHPAVTTVIPGARNASQVRGNVAAATAPTLDRSDWALIDRVTPPGGGRKIWPA